MANPLIKFYNFYRRYRWRDVDFSGWQDAHLETLGGAFEGFVGRAALRGLSASAVSGAAFTVSSGYALSASGYFMAPTGSELLTAPAPTGAGQGVRHLVVARPLLVDSDFITRPTDPYSIVPLRTARSSQVLLIPGTPAAQPNYPTGATGANDVVLFGIRMPAGATTIDQNSIDYQVRDTMGRHSDFQQYQGRNDSRLRPQRSGATTLRISPSQLTEERGRSFLYVNKVTAAIYPKNVSGKFNEADSFYNFQTGAVSGGDAATPAFTPSIPTAGRFLVARVSLKADNTIAIGFGIEGTYAECIDGIQNQRTTGAGAITILPDSFPICFVIIGSENGTTVSGIDVIDARSTFSFGGADSAKTYPTVFLSPAGNGDVQTLQAALAALPAAGGLILLTDDLVQSTPVVFGNRTKLLSRARGPSITFQGSGAIAVTGSECELTELRMIGPSGSGWRMVSVSGQYANISRCSFDAPVGASGVFISHYSFGAYVGQCVFRKTAPPASCTAIEYTLGSSENSDDNCLFT